MDYLQSKYQRTRYGYILGYIVNFDDDTVRVIYVPKFFKSMLKITNGKFKEALRMYLNEKVDSKYHRNYEPFFDYEWIERQIQEGNVPEIEFERTNGELAKITEKRFGFLKQ